MRDKQRNCRNRPLQVEALESLALLSGVTTMAATVTSSLPIVILPPIPIIVGLDGRTVGTYTSVTTNPDVGTTFFVFTHGNFNNYGEGLVTGNFHAGGFINKPGTGTLEVTLSGGTVTLALTAISFPGASAAEFERFTFVVTKGTGKFHNTVGDPVGKGVVAVFLRPGRNSTNHFGNGSVTLVFHPIPVAIA